MHRSITLFLLNSHQHDCILINVKAQYQCYEEDQPKRTFLSYYNLTTKKSTTISINWKTVPRDCFSTLLIYKDIYLFGGYTDEGIGEHFARSSEDSHFSHISLNTHKMNALRKMPNSKSNRGLCNYKAQFIYSLCGSTFGTKQAICERYAIKSNSWEKLPNASEAKTMVGCLSIGNWIYMVGGMGKGGLLSTIEKIAVTGGNSWLLVKIQSSSDLLSLCSCFPIFLGNSSLLVIGDASKLGTYGYIVDVQKGKIVRPVKLPGDSVLGTLKTMNSIYLGSRNWITKFRSDFTYSGRINIGNLEQDWVSENINIEVPNECEKYPNGIGYTIEYSLK
jgi:hypothetical protein